MSRDNEWSFDYRAGARTRVCPTRRLPYSPDPADYSVRCAPHHAVWDAINLRGGAPTVEAAGWLLDRMDAHGGEVAASVINAEARAAGIPRERLSAARRNMTRIVSVPAHGRSQRHRIWRLPRKEKAGAG